MTPPEDGYFTVGADTDPEVLADPHTLTRRMVVDLLALSAGPPPCSGSTREILAELGYSEPERIALADQGVVSQSDPPGGIPQAG